MTEITLTLSLNELCQAEGIASEIIIDIVEYEIAKPIVDSDDASWLFDTTSVHWIKKAVRLNQDLELDWVAVALVIDLMQQKESLQKENAAYKLQLDRFVDN